MDSAHRFFAPLKVDNHGNLDFAGGDHVDVDAVFGQRLEHLRRDAGVAAHADTNNRELADVFVGADFAEGNFGSQAVDDFGGFQQIRFVHGEGNIGGR